MEAICVFRPTERKWSAALKSASLFEPVVKKKMRGILIGVGAIPVRADATSQRPAPFGEHHERISQTGTNIIKLRNANRRFPPPWMSSRFAI
jgi:hypothetical protein